MRIIHISCIRELTNGQRKQLSFEFEAIKELNIDWDIVAFHTGDIVDNRFEKKIPKNFRRIFLRNLYVWLYILKYQKNYDVIINRHIPFDPFVLIFGWFINNRFSLHHAKEVEALKVVKKNWKGKIASILEKITGFVSLKQSKGAICVTNDIALYQSTRANIKTFVYPNGINLSTAKIIKDKRNENTINIAFMCGTFSLWHGLDLLINSVLENLDFMKKNNVQIHLIGRVLEKELNIININNLPMLVHGLLSTEEYIKILENCDIGLDSLALYREGLSEGSALKVREYLAFGLPIFSGYKDTAIPKNFKFYKIGSVDIKEITLFAKETKQYSRKQVREESEKFISKTNLVKKIYKDLKLIK